MIGLGGLSIMRTMAACVFALALGLPVSNAFAADWVPYPGNGSFVGVAYTHDDGGQFAVGCVKSKKLMLYALKEPRANWHKGDIMTVQVKADDGTQMQPSNGQVIAPQEIAVGEQSTWDLYVIGKASAFFATAVGGYARVWPMSNFKQATMPILAACGDHW